MKRIAASAFLIILFTVFAIFLYFQNTTNSVLKIINPTLIQVDINNNGILDDDETICIDSTEAFMPGLEPEKPIFITDDVNQKDLIALGYITLNYSKDILSDKQVKLIFSGKKSHECRYADINIDGQSYSEKLYEAGLAAKNGKFNYNKFTNRLKQAQNLKLVIYNNKSNKFHKLDCKYGILSSDYIIMQSKELPKDAAPCKFCHIKNQSAVKDKTQPVKIQPTISKGSIRLILTDYTKILKPDRKCTSDVCKALLNEINNSNQTIDIAIYGWDMIPDLYNALAAAHNRGVKIRIVFDRSYNNDDYYKETLTILKVADKYNSDYRQNNSSFTNQLMHNKFFIFDNSKVFTGSMNISSTGTSGFNSNAVVIIDSKDAAKLYTYEFEQMLSGKFHSEKQKPNIPNSFTIGKDKLSIYFSPYDKTFNYIVPLINKAQKYIYIPAFLITHNELSNALINAKNRGVDVKIIIDANSTSTRNTKHAILRQNNVPLKTENYAGRMHSKSIIIDDKYLITGSMNFSNSGENKNDENCLIIESPEIARFYRNYFIYLWSKIPDKWLKYNAKAEGYDSIGSCSDGIDNDFDGYIDNEDTGCLKVNN